MERFILCKTVERIQESCTISVLYYYNTNEDRSCIDDDDENKLTNSITPWISLTSIEWGSCHRRFARNLFLYAVYRLRITVIMLSFRVEAPQKIMYIQTIKRVLNDCCYCWKVFFHSFERWYIFFGITRDEQVRGIPNLFPKTQSEGLVAKNEREKNNCVLHKKEALRDMGV